MKLNELEEIYNNIKSQANLTSDNRERHCTKMIGYPLARDGRIVVVEDEETGITEYRSLRSGGVTWDYDDYGKFMD